MGAGKFRVDPQAWFVIGRIKFDQNWIRCATRDEIHIGLS